MLYRGFQGISPGSNLNRFERTDSFTTSENRPHMRYFLSFSRLKIYEDDIVIPAMASSFNAPSFPAWSKTGVAVIPAKIRHSRENPSFRRNGRRPRRKTV